MKRNKFNAKKVVVDGETFDSMKEYRRWCELKILERAGEISGLQRQVYFELIPKQKKPSGGVERPTGYTADAAYWKDGKYIVEDTKSEATRKEKDFPIRRKLLLQVHGIELLET